MAQEIVFDPAYMELLEAPVQEGSEPEAFDADADYNRPAPPIKDGWYWATIRNAGVRVNDKIMPYRESQWSNETRKYHEVAVKAELHKTEDPIADGKTVFQAMPLRTKPDPDRGNASSMSAAYKALAGHSIAGLPGGGHAKQMVDLLQTEPQCWIKVQNILRDQDADKAYSERKKAGTLEPGEKRPKTIYSEKNIMALEGGKDSQGHYTGVGVHPETGERCVARAYIVEFKPKDFDPEDPYGKKKKAGGDAA